MPGEFLWPWDHPSSESDDLFFTPMASPQAFDKYLDYSAAKSQATSISGTDVKYLQLDSFNTIDNTFYGITGGQPVEILMLWAESSIPTTLIEQATVESYRSDPRREFAFRVWRQQ